MKETFNLTYLGLFPLGRSPSGKGMGIKMIDGHIFVPKYNSVCAYRECAKNLCPCEINAGIEGRSIKGVGLSGGSAGVVGTNLFITKNEVVIIF